jgi:nitronate monooxygenase
MLLEQIRSPIVQAPLEGGASTPALAAAVSGAGALGVVAGGYKSVEALKADVDAVRVLTGRPFAVNVFCPPGGPGDRAAVERYAARLRASGVPDDALGAPRRDDDAYADKVAALVADPVDRKSTRLNSSHK